MEKEIPGTPALDFFFPGEIETIEMIKFRLKIDSWRDRLFAPTEQKESCISRVSRPLFAVPLCAGA
jgi:hypothetical protein